MTKDITTVERAITAKDVFIENTKENNFKKDVELKVLTEQWEYKKSAASMKQMVYKWKNMTVKVMRGLWEAHYVLTEASREYQNSKLNEGNNSPCVTNVTHGKNSNMSKCPEGADGESWADFCEETPYGTVTRGGSWADYCSEVGISKMTAHRWLKRFIPREMSASGEDRMLSTEELAQITAEEADTKFAWIKKMVDQYEITKVRPVDWTQECENELQQRATTLRITQQVDDMVSTWSNKPKYKQMTFYQEWEKANDLEDIRLPDPRLTQYQFKFFEAIDDYLRSFDNLDIRSSAARNMREKILRRMNEDFYNQMAVEDQKKEELMQSGAK